jgi:hypothetical protein
LLIGVCGIGPPEVRVLAGQTHEWGGRAPTLAAVIRPAATSFRVGAGDIDPKNWFFENVQHQTTKNAGCSPGRLV